MNITRLQVCHVDELLEAIVRSRDVHRPWVEPPAEREALVDYLAVDEEVNIRYGVRASNGDLAGVINLNNIVRGAFRSAFLGYFVLAPYQGKGLMRAGLTEAITAAFGEHDLHRLEANVQPANERSQALVKGLGFRLEGFSPRYLFIDGEWRDHNRFAITAEEWHGGQ